MKTPFACCVALRLFSLFALGIPQTFGTNQFLTSAGVSFEQFAADPAAWADSTALKGHWEAHGDTLTLADSAAVFGVAADEVTAKQRDGQVQSFRVVFRGKDKHGNATLANLLARVTANVRAFTGDAGTSAPGGGTVFKYKAVTITLRSGSGQEVVAEFARA